MNVSSKLEAISELRSSIYSDYLYTIIQSRVKDAKDDFLSILSSMLSFKDKYEDLINKEMSLSKEMDKAGLRFIMFYSKYKTANFEMADNKITYCQKYLGD